MKEKDLLLDNEQQESAGVRPRARGPITVLAFLLCLALALVVWVCVMNTVDTDYILLALPEGVDCALSGTAVKVEGPVSALKELDVIYVNCEGLAPGSYPLTTRLLVLPEGVHLCTDIVVYLTVGE